MMLRRIICQDVRDWLIRALLLQVLWTTTVKGIDVPAPPTNVKVSNITCTSALVSWDEATDGSHYNVEWRLLNHTAVAGSTGSQDIRDQHHMMMEDLQPSDDHVMSYIVSVSSIRKGVKGNSSDVVFSTRSNAVAVQPYAVPSVSGVTIEWSAVAINTGCDGHTINEYVIRYNPVGSTDVHEIPVQPSEQDVIENINDTLSLTQYEYTVVIIDPNGTNISSDIRYFTTQNYLPAAPINLSYEIVSNHMLMVSWYYPPSLIEQITSFEVTYSLVSAYNTSAGMKSFAEYDIFYTTETSFHFALVSSVTNYIFTVTPYSATRAGDSARVLVDDFSAVDLVEDPVIFFNLRLSDTTNNPSYSSDISERNLDLTRMMQSSISDICQCTLPSYTLRGSMESCDSQSNCAIYTGRLLGSDTASATEVFEMVENWLSTQNGSLLNGALSIDPDCPLRRLSPTDTVCSYPNITSDNTTEGVEENEPSNDRQGTDGLMMLAIGFASGFAIIICVVLICAGVYKSSKLMKRKKTDALTHSESEARLTPFLQTPFQQTADVQRHYSVVIEHNPSYNRHHNNVIKPFILSNDRQLEASSSDTENPYSYTSLKSAQRQADALGFRQPQGQDDGITHATVEQSLSGSYTNEYVVEALTSSGYNFNEQCTTTEFHPSSTPDGHGAYLSVS